MLKCLWFMSLCALVQSAPTSHSLLRNRQYQNNSIPQFALQHAPLFWLDRDEQFFPSDIPSQVINSYPTINRTRISDPPSPLTIDNLDDLNQYGDNGEDVYLHSNEGINAYETTPWLHGTRPDSTGKTPNAISSTIITVPKPNNITDVFYFTFFAFNQGNNVFENPSLELGDHVGDWEHVAIRFDTSNPQAPNPTQMWFSQHSYGQAFAWASLSKDPTNLRPYVYIARGSHANYAVPGPHDHTLPNGLNGLIGPLIDHTSRGTLWDSSLNCYHYNYDTNTASFSSYGDEPVNWLYCNGRWGDAQLGDKEEGQKDFFGFKKYEGGPTGPRDKGLDREEVCPDGKDCTVRWVLTPKE